MSKRSLMLSTAVIAILSGAALADTTVTDAKTTPYWTGTKPSGATGEDAKGNITLRNSSTGGTGSISVTAGQGAITINSNNWVLNQGTISNKDANASGIRIDLSANRDVSGAAAMGNNAAGTAIPTGTGIYLDTTGTISVTGSGINKSGIFLDASGCPTASTTCSFTGDITTLAGSSVSVTGDGSFGINIGSKADLIGDLNIAGTVAVSSDTTTNSVTNVYGMRSLGHIQGDVTVAAGAQLTAIGHAARGMSIQGTGVDGSITIGGLLGTAVPTPTVFNPTQQVNTTTNPEAGPALEIGASVTHGIGILGPTTATTSGQISVAGMGSAIYIGPAANSAPPTTVPPLTIGVFTDSANPGFSFSNRGSISITPNNFNDSSGVMAIQGTATVPVILSGGIFNSGSMTATAVSSGTAGANVSPAVIGITIGDYVQIQEGTGKLGPAGLDPGNQAAIVNSGAASSTGGVISASVSGSRGGSAQAIYISAQGNVPSIINTGSILASATTTDATIAGGNNQANPLFARAIVDLSGTLTRITNSGAILTQAGFVASQNAAPTPLNNNAQLAIAIDLRGNSAGSASAAGVSILNHSSASRAASITGDIFFGTGDNQILDLEGGGSNLMSTVTGNVTFGQSRRLGAASGDRLRIGRFSTLTGKVTTNETIRGFGVQVDVETGGTLTILNSGTSLNSTTFTVQNGGNVFLGVGQSQSASGGVVAAQTVDFQAGSRIGVAYASFVPQNAHQFVLMTADAGHLGIDSATLAAFNNATNTPFLLSRAELCVTGTAGCTRPTGLDASLDALIVDVVPKAPVDPVNPLNPDTTQYVGLNPNSIAMVSAPTLEGPTTLFEQANLAMGVDDALGSAFINGVHNKDEAQKGYNNFAPNITGGTRAIAISITDSATGPVGARQRALRMYGKTSGEMTLWGQQFVQMIKEPGEGAIDANTGFNTSPGFKDHGFGFSLGLDMGSPKYGFYGGALTFYAGDVNELSRDSHENQQWYLLSLYSTWRGKGLFLDTKLDAGYGHVDGKRRMVLVVPQVGTFVRQADNTHAGALISGGVTTGAMFSYGATTLMPQISLDGLYLREEGYTEHNPNGNALCADATKGFCDAFQLKVNQSYAKSLRAFVGFDVRYDLELWDVFMQPEARAGYRYDFLNDPAKVKAAFAYADISGAFSAPGETFELTGPDPSQGAFVLGGTLAATTDAWSLGLNFDFVRGSNGGFTQVGTLSLIGRI